MIPLESRSVGIITAGLMATVLGLGCGRGGSSPPAGSGKGPTLRDANGAEYLAHEVIIRVAPDVTTEALTAALASVGGTVIDDGGGLGQLRYRRVQLPSDVTADVAISTLTANAAGQIERAEPNYVVQAFVTPNDTRFGELWGMAKISAPAAWDTTTGSSAVLVVVSDTGMDYTVPELAANAWTNPGEIPGNGVDDDHNGYVDDVHGYDFANSDSDPLDDHGHGTHVSGTIGAIGNNNAGVAGVNWKVKIAAAKFLSASGSGSSWGGAQSILYAAAVKARAVNASWGCFGSGCYASYVEDAIRTLEQSGGIFIAAAGNNANNNEGTPTYPANYNIASLVAVAATDSNDALASFSNYGATHVHVAAPGVNILSTLPGGSFAAWSGTSMATPHVTGAAALYLSMRPDATPLQIKQQLMATTDPVAGLAGKVATGGRINVQRLIASAGHAPAAPSGVNAAPSGHGNVVLTWNANSEPDLNGYKVRWGTATGTYSQSLDVPKTLTTAQVSGLQPGTKYFFVVYAVSATGLQSPPSTELAIVAGDSLAPPQVVDLVAAPLPGSEASGDLLTASGEFSEFWAAKNVHDGSPDTAWISPARDAPQEEEVTIGLYTPFLIDGVDLLPSAAYPDLFPLDFDIEVTSDGQAWTAVAGLRGATATAGQPVHLLFSATLASAVRLRVLRSVQHESGKYYAAVAEMTIFEASHAPDTLQLTFTAPGDDPGAGQAARYDIRRSTSPITTDNFAGATAVTATGQPLAAGLPEVVNVAPLAGETTYYFALKAYDGAGNVSPMSNVAEATTLLVPPATITDLTVLSAAGDANPGMVTLGWTAPGSDGKTGQAAQYELRYSTTPMTAGDFANATPALGVPAPAPAGTAERFAVGDLTPGVTYYFALRALDEHGTAGAVSNIVAAEPADGNDVTPPATVQDLSAAFSNATVKLAPTIDSVSDELSAGRAATNLLDGDINSAWETKAASVTTPAWVVFDLGKVQPLARFRMNPSSADLIASYPQDFEVQTSTDKANWKTLIKVEGLLGKFATWNEWASPVSYARYARLYITKRGPAAGASVYAAVGEVELYALTPQLDADLTWVAPGDDGYDGTAARYDLRSATSPITEATFSTATSIPTPTPLHGGMIEVLHVPSLATEATTYFALRAVDSSGNWSAISNVASLQTPGIPPAPVGDLLVTSTAKTSMTLTFTATGDDGTTGNATAYELRYATQPLTEQSFSQATQAPTATPSAPGTKETVTVSGLAPGTLYYFAVVVIDDVGNRSLMSNQTIASTRDGTAPAAITDLTVTPVDPTTRPPLALTISTSSGSYSPGTDAKYLLDGDVATEWMSPSTTQPATQSVELALGASKRLGRLRMRAGATDAALFPVDFRFEVQAQASGPWQAVVSETGFSTQGGWEEWALGSVPAVGARLVVTKTAPWTGKYVAAVADLELYEDPTDFSKLRLSWTATGDDGTAGVASAYDLRRGPSPLDEAGFAGATPVPGLPAPQPAGNLERFEASGLSAETTYCFAIKAADEEGNISAVSNSSCASTPGVPPATITDLHVIATSASSATLGFTAPGADGNTGQAARYEVRRSPSRINTTNWDSATAVTGLAAPLPAGSQETIAVTGLAGLTTYYFAVRAVDSADNAAALSNNTTATTLDNVAPSTVGDLVAATNAAQGGSLLLSWTAPGDNGNVGRAAAYDVRVSSTPITAGNFGAATPVSVGAPNSGGSKETATVTGLGAEQTYYVALRATDSAGNVSALSNVASANTREEPPAPVSNLAIVGGSGSSAGHATLILSWTAPGDDGNVGTAQSYEMRYATGPLSAATFSAATLVTPMPAPAPAGTAQQVTVSGLAVGVKYYVALRAIDDHGNVSALSNVASGTTPDEIPPSTTTDLVAATGSTPGTLTVTLTAPGDDGMDGRATAYELRWSTSPLGAGSFGTATVVSAPSPGTPGVPQTFTVSGLPNETDVHLMLRTRDDVGNWSALSNDAQAMTPSVPPAAIADLRVVAQGTGTVTLGWTATGDDGRQGTAVGYDLRAATTPITDATFATATPISAPSPAAAGTAQTATATGLAANKTYYFAIKAVDDLGNWSPLSNVVAQATEDTIAPGAIALAAATGPTAGSIMLTWTATGDDGNQGTAARYELRRSLSPITAANFAAATVVAMALTPRVAGTPEAFTVTGLAGETTHHFAIRAIDEAGNAGPSSNDAAADTSPVAPAAVTLTATLAVNNGVATATLSWTAPGDDGNVGQAKAYDLRYSTAALSAANFAAATALTAPSPAPAGTTQTATLPNLKESTTYSFAIKTVDDTNTWSALSNVATVVVPDLTKPAAPGGLTVVAPDVAGKPLSASSVTGSSTLGPAWDASNAADGDATSSWASAGSTDGAAQSLVLDLGATRSIEQVKLTADAKYLGLFPRGFTIDVSADNSQWKTVATETAFTVTNATPVAWGFPSQATRYVRLAIDDMGTSYGQHYAILAEMQVVSAAASDGQAQLTWVAPGDDGMIGTATRYEVYRHTQTFGEAQLGAVTLVSGAPSPGAAGTLQTMTVTGLHGETDYFWAVRAIDEAGNTSPLSAVVPAKTNNVPPAAVRDLAGHATGMSTIALTWTATGDDGASGVAASVDLRYSKGTLSSQTFADATMVTGVPAPGASGAAQSVTVSGLDAGATYHFGLIAKDAAGNASFLSNIAVVTTVSPPDTVPPDAITDLTLAMPPPGGNVLTATVVGESSEQSPGFRATAVADHSTDTFWASVPRAASQEEWVRLDAGSMSSVDQVRIWPSAAYPQLFPPDLAVRVSPDGLAWTTVATATSVTATPGVPVTLAFPAQNLRYVELRATRLPDYGGGIFYAAVAEIEIVTANEPAGTIVASWTSPHDAGPTGQAAHYDLRVGACPFDATTASPAATAAPLSPATPERSRITGVPSGTVCVAVRSSDAAGNMSALSNVATIVVP